MNPRLVKSVGWTLIVLTPVLVLGGIELLARMLDLHPSGGPRPEIPVWLDRNIVAKEGEWIQLLSDSPGDLANYYRTYQWDRYLFYKLRPHLDLMLTDVATPAVIRDRTRWLFHTNAHGFNTPDVPFRKPHGVFRIVALGDSSTFGWGVDPQRNYPFLLEVELKRRYPEAKIEVVNLGVCGYTSLQGRVLLEREALRYDPDVVILSYGSNDFSRVPVAFDELYERNLGWMGALQSVMQHSRAYQVYASFLAGAAKRTSNRRVRGNADAEPRGVLNVGPEKSVANMMEMVRIAREHDIDPVFVTNCVRGSLGGPIHAAATRTGVPILNTENLLEASIAEVLGPGRFQETFKRYRDLYGDALVERFPWLAVYLGDHCHPNIIGHQLIAEALAPMIAATPSFGAYRETLH
ncbi:MAG: SGNH/GDSL hydrolase family protein [Acidobacteriota bacterium]